MYIIFLTTFRGAQICSRKWLSTSKVTSGPESARMTPAVITKILTKGAV